MLMQRKKPLLGDAPVEYYHCGVNWNGTVYNVSAISDLHLTYTFRDKTNDYEYFVSLCDDLQAGVYPIGVDPQFGVNGIRMNVDTNFYEPIAFHDTQSYDLVDDSDPEGGFVIRTTAQATDPESPYKYYYLTFVFIPGNQASVRPIFNYTFEDSEILNIALEFVTSFAKPTKGPIPEPTPLPPTCKYFIDHERVHPFAINLNLGDLAHGPHGYAVTFDNDKDTIALYQPCGYSSCPIDFDCGNYTRASAWVCNRSMKCEGFSLPTVDFQLLHEDPDEGFHVVYQGLDDNALAVDTLCDFELRSGLIYVDNAKLLNESALRIRMHTNQACFEAYESEIPDTCQAELDDGTHQLSIDLTEYNQENGWRFPVENEKFVFPHWVDVQPCGALTCPGDDCGGSTGATVWLCENQTDGFVKCIDYGLYRKPITVESFMTTLDRGLSINYVGNNERSSHIRLQCNWTGQENHITWHDNLDYTSGGAISLYAYSRDVCVGPAPSPAPTAAPTPAPTTGPTPAPTPEPTPSTWAPPTPSPTKTPQPIGQRTSTLYLENETHSITVDLSGFSFANQVQITYQNNKYDAYLHTRPFVSQTPPSGYTAMGLQKADTWLCWDGNCWPVMDGPTYGVYYDPTNGELSGIAITAYSYYDTIFESIIKCDQTESEPSSTNIVSFNGDNTYTFTSNWNGVCPAKHIQPTWPDPPTTPTPSPASQPYPIQYSDDDYYFDFATLGSSNVDMTYQLDKTVEVGTFMFDPDGVISCPSGAECKGVEKATAWKCWVDAITSKQNCIAVADVRYPPEQITASKVVYAGGYSTYQLEMKLNCKSDHAATNYTIDNTATESSSQYLTVNLYSQAFCPGRGLTRNGVTGGAVFVFIIGVIIILYCVIGLTYNFLSYGKFEFPNSNLWQELGSSIATAFNFITCRRRVIDVRSEKYDAI